MDVVSIAQVASAIGTVGLTVLFGLQLRVFYRQVLVNSDTLREMRESRTAHERPTSVTSPSLVVALSGDRELPNVER